MDVTAFRSNQARRSRQTLSQGQRVERIVRELDARQRAIGERILDRQARRYLSMSGNDFRRRYLSGELDLEDSRVIRLSFLLHNAQPVHYGKD